MSITRVHIPETKIDGQRLGRHVHHDDRSLAYKPQLADKLVSVIHKGAGVLPLNQGEIGQCTGDALAGALDLAPNWKQGVRIRRQADATQLYKWETALEGQPYPPNDPGGSGLNVCKVAHKHGWISSYAHAIGIEQALLALVLRPTITGVDWYDSFDTPAKDGQISIAANASVRGGHEFVQCELDVPTGATIDDLDDIKVWCWQSWGKQFALGGRFYMTAATWSTLLQHQGDVTVPVVG